jgi:eukaryotic-like serine/threonine-protein kinase
MSCAMRSLDSSMPRHAYRNGPPDFDLETCDLREGDVVDGKYRVAGRMGSGEMGTVYAARDLQRGTDVAIKALRAEMLENEDAVERLRSEATAVSRIASEHVVRVLDAGSLATGAPYMVMDLLQGQDCAQVLDECGPLPIDQAVALVAQACAGVACAHALGIVHRDLKPSNLFCVRGSDDRPLVKLLDFGISKVDPGARSAPNRPVTYHGVFGSPYYMSPEQWRNTNEVDAATDIWALGVILYELLAGQVPFPGNSVGEIALGATTKPPLSLREHREEVPPELEQVVLKCLAKDKGARYRDVAELSSALATYIERSVAASEPATAASSAPTPAPDVRPTQPRIARVGTWLDRRLREATSIQAVRVAAVVLGACVVFVGGLAGLRGLHSVVPPQTAPIASPALVVRPAAFVGSLAPVPAPSAAVRSALPAAPGRAAPTRATSRRNPCDPPYYFDARGNRVFKVSCV